MYMYIYIYIYIYFIIYIYIYIYICSIYIYIYIYICYLTLYTYIYTYIHTYVLFCPGHDGWWHRSALEAAHRIVTWNDGMPRHSCHILPFRPILWNRYLPPEPANTANNSPKSISEGGRIWQVCMIIVITVTVYCYHYYCYKLYHYHYCCYTQRAHSAWVWFGGG